jgi:hypothetical protein
MSSDTSFPLLQVFKHTPNHVFCELCYCYICDVPASQCGKWLSHCAAEDDSSSFTPYWATKRAEARALAKVAAAKAKKAAGKGKGATAGCNTGDPDGRLPPRCVRCTPRENLDVLSRSSFIGSISFDAMVDAPPSEGVVTQQLQQHKAGDGGSHKESCFTPLRERTAITCAQELLFAIENRLIRVPGATGIVKGTAVTFVPERADQDDFLPNTSGIVKKINQATGQVDVEVTVRKNSKKTPSPSTVAPSPPLRSDQCSPRCSGSPQPLLFVPTLYTLAAHRLAGGYSGTLTLPTLTGVRVTHPFNTL